MASTNRAITVALSSERLAGTFAGNLGIELTEITDEHVRGRMLVDKRHLHPAGYVHGGAWVAFADTVAAWGTLRHLPDGRGFTTVELKINVLASAGEGDELTAVGETSAPATRACASPRGAVPRRPSAHRPRPRRQAR